MTHYFDLDMLHLPLLEKFQCFTLDWSSSHSTSHSRHFDLRLLFTSFCLAVVAPWTWLFFAILCLIASTLQVWWLSIYFGLTASVLRFWLLLSPFSRGLCASALITLHCPLDGSFNFYVSFILITLVLWAGYSRFILLSTLVLRL